MSIPFTPSFVETNLVYKENELIEYAITSGISPIKAHRGVMQFTDLGNNRTRLNYTISFKGRVPFIGPIIKAALQNGVSRGLKNLSFNSLIPTKKPSDGLFILVFLDLILRQFS